MDKASIGDKYGKKNYLDKKVPLSNKYSGVKSSLNTGKTVKDMEIMSDQLVSKRKFEGFKRLKSSTLAKLLGEQNFTESIYNLAAEEEVKEGAAETESVFSLNTNATGVSAVTYATEALGITSDTKFLLLDLRDEDEFDKWHIKEAICFPVANLARDKVSPELFRFKNKEDKLIVVYMNDERAGTQAGKLFVEKGYENVFLLSGGIEEFHTHFFELVEGKDVPPIPKAEPKKGTKKK